MNTDDTDYNAFIAQELNLDKSLDFINDSQAIREAEKQIEARNLRESYLLALNSMNSGKSLKSDLSKFQVSRPGFKALAIVKMLKEKN